MRFRCINAIIHNLDRSATHTPSPLNSRNEKAVSFKQILFPCNSGYQDSLLCKSDKILMNRSTFFNLKYRN